MGLLKRTKKFFILSALIGTMGGVSALAANHVSSNCWKEQSENKYRSSGWVNILDDKGAGVYHYSNAQLKSAIIGTVYAESGRIYGTGTVSATSSYTPNNGNAKIYYGY